ncbi:GCFC2 factor, partial [Crypturellus undulatus]|nr:GCFC2 factor [Crypturellus undulatus]
ARQRAASSGSSGEEEQEKEKEPPPPPAPDSDSEQGAESEEEPGPSSPQEAAGSLAGQGAGAAEARGPRLAEKALLSFGGEEEREDDEELFKIKKPSFNEVTFRIQKKESLQSPQREVESKKADNIEVAHEEEEEEDETHSSLSENDDNKSSDSETESSLTERRKDLSAGNIPDAGSIEAARRKRRLARTQADYLPLDVLNNHDVSRRRASSDLESEDDIDMRHLNFAPKARTLRQRMAEHIGEFLPFLSLSV